MSDTSSVKQPVDDTQHDTTLPSDPLSALGASIFLQFLSNLSFPNILKAEQVCRPWRECILTHSRTVWRQKCVDEGVQARHIKTLEGVETALRSGWNGYEPGEEEHEPESGDTASGVDWRGICKKEVELDRNWRFGRCTERWITMPGNDVWRIKVDDEQGTMISTSRTGGLHVVDLQTSIPLFSLTGVRPYAHLEHAKGFVIFDIEHSDFALTVYRTQPAITRSSHPTPPSSERPQLSTTAKSYTHPSYDAAGHEGPLPRGYLAYYRTIKPPTMCRAFRARLDYEGVEAKERAVLAAAGTEGIYIWDLDEKSRVEVIRLPPGEQEEVQYIEFDEEYVFLCGRLRVNIYSRNRKGSPTAIASFPPKLPPSNDSTLAECIAVATEPYTEVPCSLVSSTYSIHPGALPSGLPIPISRTKMKLLANYRKAYSGVMTLDIWDFCALHYTLRDLIFVSRVLGVIFIIRDYRRILHPSLSADNMRKTMKDQTIVIQIGQSVEHLSIHGTRVTVITEEEILFFDTSTLPEVPSLSSTPDDRMRGSRTPPGLDIHSIRSITGAGITSASCIQADRQSIYVTYQATPDAGIGGVLDITPGSKHRFMPPAAALEGMGMCVRVWDFAST